MVTKLDVLEYNFREYIKLGTTKISDEILPVGTLVSTSEGVYRCTEPSRLALDANDNVYPIAVSVFRKSFERAK